MVNPHEVSFDNPVTRAELQRVMVGELTVNANQEESVLGQEDLNKLLLYPPRHDSPHQSYTQSSYRSMFTFVPGRLVQQRV